MIPNSDRRGNQITNSILAAAEVISTGHEAQLDGPYEN